MDEAVIVEARRKTLLPLDDLYDLLLPQVSAEAEQFRFRVREPD